MPVGFGYGLQAAVLASTLNTDDDERDEALASPGAVGVDDLLGANAQAQQERIEDAKEEVLGQAEVGRTVLSSTERDRDITDTRAGVLSDGEGGELEVYPSDIVTSTIVSEALRNLDEQGDSASAKNVAVAATVDLLGDMRATLDSNAAAATAMQQKLQMLEAQYADASKPVALWRQIFASVGGGMVTYATGDGQASLRFMKNLYDRRDKAKKNLLEIRSIATSRLGELQEESRLTRNKMIDVTEGLADDFRDEERYARERREALMDMSREELLADMRSELEFNRRIAEDYYSKEHQEQIDQQAAILMRRHDREMAELRSGLDITEQLAGARLTAVARNIAQFNLGAEALGKAPLSIAEEKRAFRIGISDAESLDSGDKDLLLKIRTGAHEAAIDARRQKNLATVGSLADVLIDLGHPQAQAVTGDEAARGVMEGAAIGTTKELGSVLGDVTGPVTTSDGLFERNPQAGKPDPVAPAASISTELHDLTRQFLDNPAKAENMMAAANDFLEAGNPNAAIVQVQAILQAYKKSPDHARYIEDSPNIGARITHLLARIDEATGMPVSEAVVSAFGNEIDTINRKQKIITMEERAVKSSVQSAGENQRRLSKVRARLAQLEAKRTEDGVGLPGFENARAELKAEERRIQGQLGETLNTLRDAGYSDQEIQQFVNTFSGLTDPNDLLMFFDPPESLSGIRSLN